MSILEKILDTMIALSAFAFITSSVIYGLLFIGAYIPDNQIWLVPKEPSEKTLDEIAKPTYFLLRGLVILAMTLLYLSGISLFLVLLMECVRPQWNRYKVEYEEELRLKQLYDKNLRGESLTSTLLYV